MKFEPFRVVLNSNPHPVHLSNTTEQALRWAGHTARTRKTALTLTRKSDGMTWRFAADGSYSVDEQHDTPRP